MKSCKACKHAEWHRTAAGRLHPSGDGTCGKEVVVPPAPAAYYWLPKPKLAGGQINRREELKDHCAYFEWGSHEPAA